MTREQALETIRAACIAANPERFDMRGLATSEQIWEEAVATIRLADVLLAIHVQNGVEDVTTFRDKDFYNSRWNLRADDATRQTDETLLFIADLLK